MKSNAGKTGIFILCTVIIFIVAAGWLKISHSPLQASTANPVSYADAKHDPGDIVVNESNGSLPSMKTLEKANQDTAGTDEFKPCADGTFFFNNVNMSCIIQELSQHYHMKVQCKGVLSEKTYFGTFSRCEPLGSILSFLHQQTHIGFSIRGDSIIVQP